MKKPFKFVFLLLLLFWIFPLSATKPADIILVVDQSHSIQKNLPYIKDFISKRIFEEIAEKGDNVHLLTFDGSFYEKKVLKAGADAIEVGYALNSIRAVGGYTDLTNAVISMTKYIDENVNPSSRKIIFFLTDGLNEPPEFSPYQQIDDSFFQSARASSQEGGWKVFIVGIGEQTSAPRIAEVLGAELVALGDSPSLEEFDALLTERMVVARKEIKTLYLVVAGLTLTASLMGGGGYLLYRRNRFSS